jgi:hypothetical protein
MTSTIGWKALTEDARNTWLLTADPNRLLESHGRGWNIGYFDLNGDNSQGLGERTQFFMEAARGGNVYVLTLDPQTSADGLTTFRVQVQLKNANGTRSTVDSSAFNGGDWAILSSQSFALTKANLQSLMSAFRSWCSSTPQVTNAPTVRFDWTFFNHGPGQWDDYYGWTDKPVPTVVQRYTYTVKDPRTNQWVVREGERRVIDPARNYIPIEQGNGHVNRGGDFIGGWGGWTSYESGISPHRGGGVKYHFVGAYAAYEAGLSGTSYTAAQFYQGENQGWATRNGITIGKVTVTIGGVPTETMGFKKTLGGNTYEFYWDPVARGNRLARVTDANGTDITQRVLALQTRQLFGTSWANIQSQLVVAEGNGASLGVYGGGFTPENTSGSAEAPTAAEIARFNAFKADSRWLPYIDGTTGRIKSLPASASERQAMLAELLRLNPAHILSLFTGGADTNGLQLFMTLLRGSELTESSLLKTGEIVGKLMYLAGRELARKTGDSSQTTQVEFFKNLHRELAEMAKDLALLAVSRGFEMSVMQRLYFSVLLGLRNYTATDGSLTGAQLTPEETVLWLINRLSSAGNLSGANYSAENARALSAYMSDVLQVVGTYMALNEMRFGSEEIHRHSTAKLSIGLYLQEQLQKLSILAMGALSSHAANSSAAKDVFDNAQKTKHEESRKLEDAIAALLSKYWDMFLELVKTTTKG